MTLLRKIKTEDFPVLRSFLNTKLYSSISILILLDVEENFEFSRPIFVSREDPTKFIFAKDFIHAPKSFSIFWDVERVSDSELKEYLLSVPDWNWDEEFMVASLDASLARKLDSVLLEGGVSSKPIKREFSEPSFVLRTTEEKLIHRSLPDGFQFGVLKDTQMPNLFSTWKYSEYESIEDFQKFVKIFPTSAVYRKEDKLQNHPLSYIFYYHYGFMGMIHTDPEYRRLGLASAVFSNLCSKLAEKKILMLTQINIDNEASFEMHKKLGFEIVNEVCWNGYIPETN